MRIRFTHHAQAGMMERSISASQITETLRRPASIFPTRGGAVACTRQFGAKTLKVIYRIRGKSEYVIITAYYL